MSASLEAVGRAVQFSGLGKEVRDKRQTDRLRVPLGAATDKSRVESSRAAFMSSAFERLDAERVSLHASGLGFDSFSGLSGCQITPSLPFRVLGFLAFSRAVLFLNMH